MAGHIPNNPLVCKVAMVFRRDTRTFVNTFHVAKSDGWDVVSMTNCAVDFHTWWTDVFKTATPSGISLVQIQVRLLDPSNPLAVDYTDGLPESGAFSADLESANVTQTLSWRTGLAGRKYRGRTYIPGVADTQTNQDDTTKSAFVTFLSTVASGFLSIIASGTRFPVVFHLGPDTFTRITSFVIENILDSQRRRLPGRGR